MREKRKNEYEKEKKKGEEGGGVVPFGTAEGWGGCEVKVFFFFFFWWVLDLDLVTVGLLGCLGDAAGPAGCVHELGK